MSDAGPAFDLDRFLSLPRVSGLDVSPEGARLVTSVATVAADGKRFATALWQLDPTGVAPPRRLTRSSKGEANARFAPDGSILFTSARDDPDEKPGDDEEHPSGLWRLPSGCRSARACGCGPTWRCTGPGGGFIVEQTVSRAVDPTTNGGRQS